MKIGMLIGACGMALTGTAMADVAEVNAMTGLEPQMITPYVTADYRSPSLRATVEDVDTGRIRSLADSAVRGGMFVYRDTFDELDADQMRPQEIPGAYIRAIDLDTGPTSETSLVGQRTPDDGAFAVQPWLCIVDNAVAISADDGDPMNGEYVGPPGGPDPTGVRDGLLSLQRASAPEDPINPGFIQTQMNHNMNFYTGTQFDPHVLFIDVYRTNVNDLFLMNIVSNTEGGSVMQSLITGSVPGFAIGTISGDPNTVSGLSCLMEGTDPSLAPRTLNSYELTTGWMTICIFSDPSRDLQAVFVRDDVTSAPLGGARGGGSVYQLPDNLDNPSMKMYEEFGLGLEDGWVQVMPGTLDDPGTPDIIEGAGFCVDGDLVSDNIVIDVVDGNRISQIGGFTFGMDRIDFAEGDDNMIVRDEWIDDIRVMGIPFPAPDPIPAYRVPYVDDIEHWTPGLMALQGGRYDPAPTSGLLVSEMRNSTTGTGSDGGPPTQSLALPNSVQDGFYRIEYDMGLPTDPPVISQIGDPVVAEVNFFVENDQIGYTFAGADGIYPESDVEEDAGFFLTSATNEMLLGDGQTYVRQRKPIGTDTENGEYDPTEPVVPLSGPDLTPSQVDVVNTEFTNVLAAPAGMSSFSFPLNSFTRIRLEIEPGAPTGRGTAPNGDTNILRVFVGGTQLFPDGDSSRDFTTDARSMNELEFGSTNLLFPGSEVLMYADDIFFDGPTQPDGTVPLDGGVYGDDPAWELPFADGLDSYDTTAPAPGQGFANYRADFLPVQDPDVSPVQSDFSEIEFVEGAPALSMGDDVILYEVFDLISGTPGFAEGDIVAVSADIFSEINPDDNTYGRVPGDDGMGNPVNDPTEFYIVDSVGGSVVARGTWYLANATGEGTFDPSMMHVDAGIRFSYRLAARWGGTAAEASFVSAASAGVDTARGSRGDVVRLVNTANPADTDPNGGLRNNETVMFSSLLPPAETLGTGGEAVLNFDVYIAQSDFQTGFSVTFDGIGSGTVDGDITAIGFGGLGFRSADQDPMTGLFPTVPQGNFSYEITNPSTMPNAEETLWVDTGMAVPTNQWMTVELTLDENKDWTLSVDGMEIGDGKAIDFDMPSLNTTGLDSLDATRNGYGDNDGNETTGDVIWEALAPDAPAPIDGDAGEEYHGFQIGGGASGDSIFEETPGSLPDIWPVDAQTGDREMMGGMPVVRDLQEGDYVMLINNDPDTMMPFDDIIQNVRFRIVDDMMNQLGRGDWVATNTPDQFGQNPLNDGAPGGISMGNVPGSGGGYNDQAPFRDILLGNYIDVEVTTTLPADTFFIDNITLSLGAGCPADLDGLGSVGSGDLGILLAAWGSSGGPADLDGSGTVGSGDLGILLAAWGDCP